LTKFLRGFVSSLLVWASGHGCCGSCSDESDPTKFLGGKTEMETDQLNLKVYCQMCQMEVTASPVSSVENFKHFCLWLPAIMEAK
jgi:hypothetical protein